MVPKSLIAFWERTQRFYIPLSWIYGLAIRLRSRSYERGWLLRSHPGVFSVVVGNLSLGGEGKTPCTLALAELLYALDLRPVVILRGYGGKTRSPMVVSEGRGPLVSSEEAGEEAILYALRLSGVPVVVGRDRLAAARLAQEKFRPGILLFDDAFQHLRLSADLYFLIVSAARDPFAQRLFPAGYLREPLSAARRAQAVFLTRANLFPEKAELLHQRFVSLGLPCFRVHFETGPLVTLAPEGFRPFTAYRPRRILAFCGLGDPLNFEKSLRDQDFEVVEVIRFPDHHRYSPRDLRHLFERAKKFNAEALITTEKDLVKIPCGDFPLPLMALSLLVRFPRNTMAYLLSVFQK